MLTTRDIQRSFLLVFFLLAQAVAFAQGFQVDRFTADIYIRAEGYFDVVEKYDIDFTEAKHGIFRDIETAFDFKDEHGKISKHEIYLSEVEVPGRTFTTNTLFGKRFSDKLTLKIGDADQLVSGKQHYEIRYRVKNALFFTDDEVQLYWNVKPSEWLSVFYHVDMTIHIPDGAVLSPENCFVYAGNNGDTEPSSAFDYTYTADAFSATSEEGFLSVPGQSVTVLVRLPKALVQEVDFTPPFWERYRWLAIAIGFICAVFGYLKLRLSRNRVMAVTSYYPPEGIDPAMAGVLIDNTADFRDITSLLPYWATQGVIRMEERLKGDRSLYGDLKLVRLKDLPNDAAGYAYNFFHKIFAGKDEVWASSLRGIVAEPWQLLRKKSEQYYTRKNRGLKLTVLGLSWLWAFFSITFLPFVVKSYVDIESGKFIGFVIVNFLFFFMVFPFLFAYLSNKLRGKNQAGLSVMPALLGFYDFVKTAEVDRIRTLLNDDPDYFEKTMPYAVAFNLLKEWSAKFEGLLAEAPEWYSGGSTGTRFRMNTFATAFTGSMSIARNSMVTSPSSGSSSSHSGGGSSGGGAGGGGGGSW